MFDAKRFLTEYDIAWADRGKNIGPGYVGVQCPFCDDRSTHGGFNIQGAFYSCWKCGGHWMPKVIAALTKTSIPRAKRILKNYLTEAVPLEFKIYDSSKQVDFPTGTEEMSQRHRDYLIRRDFAPDALEATWGLKGTGNIGDYKNRIVAPITLHHKLISYQARDITKKSTAKYLPCPQEEEAYPHKLTLYGIDQCPGKTCVVVEGITDVWRLGPGAVCCFGIRHTNAQRLALARRFENVFIIFDNEPLAQDSAHDLDRRLSVERMVKKTSVIIIEDMKDPGGLKQSDADDIMRELL